MAPPLLLALDARVRIAGPRGERTRAARRSSSPAIGRPRSQPGELLISAIDVPKPLPAHVALLQGRQAAHGRHQHRGRRFAIDLDGRGGVRARALGVLAAWRRFRCAPWKRKRRSLGAALERSGGAARAGRARSARSTRSAIIAARREYRLAAGEEPGREVLVGAAAEAAA